MDFGRTLQQLQALVPVTPLMELIVRVWEETGYRALLEDERTVEAQGRLENLDEFLSVAASFVKNSDDSSLAAFFGYGFTLYRSRFV